MTFKINLICLYTIFRLLNTSQEFDSHSNHKLTNEQLEKVKHEEREIEVSHKELNNQALINAPIITQFPELARGCEVTSLAMLLQFAGVEVDKMTLAEEIPKVPFLNNGIYGNPNEGFVGNIYTFNEPGYAVYHQPIEELAKSYLPDQIINISGSEFDVVKEYLLSGNPVWVIVTSTFNKLPKEAWQTWETESGEINITMKEHSVLLTGFDQEYIYFNDPFKTEKNSKVEIGKFLAGWKQLGQQAITLKISDNLLDIEK
ncbi:C39 family peptidase [Litchfieldia alkalitelluris]|uniref:C39 family peptidase n=1 Tax=Litchfieldia alkalitelluris TaxID=304268 RepID=UPI000998D170|nr:C39 family peptidase [Litchfieldia alkalitelluris]